MLKQKLKLLRFESEIIIFKQSSKFKKRCCCVASVVSDSVWPHRQQPTRLRHPWDSPGKNTGVGCHFQLGSIILKRRDITLPTKVHLVKAMVFPVVMYGCESWTVKKVSAEELMRWNCVVGEDSWESLELLGDPTSPFWRRSTLGFLWKEWC